MIRTAELKRDNDHFLSEQHNFRMLTAPLNDKDTSLTIVGLIATIPTRDTLLTVAIPSLVNQARQLDALAGC